jgi:rod shape-determining protein MreC
MATLQGRTGRAQTRRRAIVYAALVSLCLLLLGGSGTAPMRELRDGIGFALAPLQSALSGVTRSVTSVVGTLAEIDRLHRDNDVLQARVAELERQAQELETLRIENQRLSQLLALRASFEHQTVTASVIGREISQFERIVVLDRGAEHGVELGDPVVAGSGGLAGSVMEVGANHSVVLLLSDRRSVVIGLIEDSRATGEVEGRLAQSLAMTKIPSTDAVAVGDRVVTAGLALGSDIRSPFPRGLLIGRVVDVQSDATAVVQTAYVESAAVLDKLEYVLVVTDFQPVAAPSPGASPVPGSSGSPAPSASPVPSLSDEAP